MVSRIAVLILGLSPLLNAANLKLPRAASAISLPPAATSLSRSPSITGPAAAPAFTLSGPQTLPLLRSVAMPLPGTVLGAASDDGNPPIISGPAFDGSADHGGAEDPLVQIQPALEFQSEVTSAMARELEMDPMVLSLVLSL